MPKMNLDWKTAYAFITDAFVGAGVPREDAEICTDVLLESDKRGIESHGCNRFKPVYIDRIKAGIQQPVTNFDIIKETPTTAVVDGHHGMGQVIGYKAMRLAIEKAKQYGMGMVAVRNSCHYGIAGYYATMAAKAGCIGMTGTNARPSVAPTFGVEGMFGTNPYTVGIPTDEAFDFIFDCATSITQNGKIEYYERIGESVHPGTIIDSDGNAVEGDAGVALKKIRNGTAALTTLGGIGEALGATRATASPWSLKCFPPYCRTVCTARTLTERTKTEISAPTTSATSLSRSTRSILWASRPAARRRAIFSAQSVPPKRHPAPTGSTPRAKRSTKFGSPASTRAYRSTSRYRRK